MTLERGDIDQEEIDGERRMRAGCFWSVIAFLLALLMGTVVLLIRSFT